MPKRFDSEEERRRYFREKQALAREKKKNLGKDLPAVSVLTEPLASMGTSGEQSGEARQAPMNVAAAGTNYDNLRTTSNRNETPNEAGATNPKAVSGSGMSGLRKHAEGISDETTGSNVAVSGVPQELDSRGGGQRPDYIPEKEWVLACERAERARGYAGKFPQFVKKGEEVYQDAMWQWENEVRGRFGGVVGGSLSGTRG